MKSILEFTPKKIGKKKPTTNRKTGCQELRVTVWSSSLAYLRFFELRMNICAERITYQQRFGTNYHHFLWFIK